MDVVILVLLRCLNFFRLSRNLVVLNSHENGTWGSEDLQPLIVMLEDGSAVRAFTKNKLIQLDIKALESKYEVFVDGAKFASFKYRIRPENVTNFRVRYLLIDNLK